ncbi:helicase/nuclease [Octadecabacter Antarctic BD virus 1]|nr:helicase/nuclease [Octadecabacter Antarctic BD virus 1]
MSKGCEQHNGSHGKGYIACGEPAVNLVTIKNDQHDGVFPFCARHSKSLSRQRDVLNVQPYKEADMTKPIENTVPEEHSSVVGGSTAARRIGCPRSYALEQLSPPDVGSSYAREGTALHEMIAIVIDQDKKPDELLPFTFKHEDNGDAEGEWSVTVDEDLWFEIGQPALDAFDDFIEQIEKETGGTFDYVVETRCAMDGIEGAFGTADVIWICGDMSGVWDWKFGRSPVDAEENYQLMFYARAAAGTSPHLFGPIDGIEGNDMCGKFSEIDPKREVILSIMQPKCNDEPSEYIVTVEELEAFRVLLMKAVKTAETEGVEAPVAKGKWCDFATCKTICPLWGGASAAFGEKMAKLGELAEAQGKPVDKIVVYDKETGEEHGAFNALLPELLDLAEQAESWAKTVFAAAHTAAQNGTPPEGWKLKEKRSSGRTWAVDEAGVKKFMKNRRFTLDEYLPRKLLTMPQCEALLKKTKREIPDEMVEMKPSSGTTLVRADHPAPAVLMSSDRASAIGDKLAALSGKTEA